MSALTVLKDMQTRDWTMNIGADTMPLPDTDLKRFYEQGISEFITGAKKLTKEDWNTFIVEFDKLGGKKWEEDGIAYAKECNLLY